MIINEIQNCIVQEEKILKLKIYYLKINKYFSDVKLQRSLLRPMKKVQKKKKSEITDDNIKIFHGNQNIIRKID